MPNNFLSNTVRCTFSLSARSLFKLSNQQVALDGAFSFAELQMNLFFFWQLHDGLEISFTDKRRFAKVRLLDDVCAVFRT